MMPRSFSPRRVRSLACAAVAVTLVPACGASSSAPDASPPNQPADSAACALDTSYTFGNDGGLGFYTDQTTLTPPASYTRTRLFSDPMPDAGASCAPALPACDDPTHIDVADILADLANADVQAALAAATPPIYGYDDRPVDGAIFRFRRADGHGFFAGHDCDGGTLCMSAVPAGIAQLVMDLKALDVQEIADPACATLR